MFGYITANAEAMNDQQRSRYRAWYCGLCRALHRNHGALSRFTLNYDMTFLVMLLSSVYECSEEAGTERCTAHPFRKHDFLSTECSDYAADMNLLLMYHNLMDNWQDDRNLLSLSEAKLFRKAAERAGEHHPRQNKAILDGLSSLASSESVGELNPDIPAEAFGGIMSELFAMREDENADELRTFGRTLGRFIYIMDACEDFDSDLRHARYNPLAAMTRADFEPTLTMLAAECTAAFDRLPVSADRDIMENILYSGMWSRFRSRNTKSEKEVLSGQ